MTLNYTDFMSQSRDILNHLTDGEISYRCAISRSYYGVYHAALNFADTVSVPPLSSMGGSSHRKLSSYFEGSFHEDKDLRLKYRKLGYSLKQLHDMRCRADYELGGPISRADAEIHIERCDLRISEIEGLSKAIAA
ncbi:hypothetical protein L1A22_08805 [Pseudomonas extremaustralis]|uniref:hypothetical protein n=1 Tax=Pseudomonas extremaustralis TaxID=359110 RepID=UPI0021CA4086|nr:hypothetical protein [Pseudomonas extremaustralis]UUJ42380.1 hypothetical protein L1A22_08805 [Pseudomonas extremaustralis]